MNAAIVRDHIIESYICQDEVCVLTEEHRIYLYDVVRQVKKDLTELRRKQKANYPNLHGDEQAAAISKIRTTKQGLGRCDELIKILRPVQVNRMQMEEILWLLRQVSNEEQAPSVGEHPGNIVYPASNADGGPASEEMSDVHDDLPSNRQPEAQTTPEPCNMQ